MSRGIVVRLEDLLGSHVVASNGRRIGHVEEVRVEHHDGEYQVMEYLLGTRALLERWSLIQRLFGSRGDKLLVRWNQMDISDPHRPRLTCPLDEIARSDAGATPSPRRPSGSH
jgi:sporulation protein YlmC with PRC-barrel domain